MLRRTALAALLAALAGCDATTSLTLTDCDGGACEPTACPFDGGTNATDCPGSWSDARPKCDAALACTSVGEQCNYPGAGDLNAGCWATAVLTCRAADAGARWACAQ